MKAHKYAFFVLILILLLHPSLYAENILIEKGDWEIRFDNTSKTFNYRFQNNLIFANAYPEATYNLSAGPDISVTPSSFSNVSLFSEQVEDNFGTGTVFTVKFEDPASKVSLEQQFYLYDAYSYILTDVKLTGTETIESNYMAPIVSNTSTSLFTAAGTNRMIAVPWDNDDFIRYGVQRLTTDLTSYEVTALFEGVGRKGLVVGSVEHDNWKSAIYVKTSGNKNLDNIRCYSGASSNITRDKLPHGKLKGTTIGSAKMFIGFFPDWRLGMEAYGHANTLIVPARTTWKKGTPFGWNSWGVIAEKLNTRETVQVSDFYKKELYDKGFYNEQGNVIIDLDSFWDNIGAGGIRQFVARCKANGQIPGIYWCPFSYWGGDLNSDVEGTNGQYKYKDCVLYANGTPLRQGGYCVDPTHPAIKQRMTAQFQNFKDWGIEYVKLDFVTNGAIQADSYYDPDITTGVQAYNHGFQDILDFVGEDMYIALSIAPVFPYQYGNSRRMSCDAWGTIGHTQYVMNCLSFGWWTDQIYQYNDPDHLVLISNDPGNETEGENRARVTSGAITGMMMFGDNFSSDTERGNPALSKERALVMMTNSDINELAKLGRSFMPVYGYNAGSNGAENFFMLHTDEYLYVACLNYGTSTLSGTIPFDLLDIEQDNIISCKELWTGSDVTLTNEQLKYAVPGKDVCVYRIEKADGQGSSIINKEQNTVKISRSPGVIQLTSEKESMTEISLCDITGKIVKSIIPGSSYNAEINVHSMPSGIYILNIRFDKNMVRNFKVII